MREYIDLENNYKKKFIKSFRGYRKDNHKRQ